MEADQTQAEFLIVQENQQKPGWSLHGEDQTHTSSAGLS